MIRASGINKRFGPVQALSELAFTIEPGELVGFVGPNGAGKTTTLRILSGYLLADSGKVEVAGHDIRSERAEACAAMGYMPEQAPLPSDMRVVEFLRFRARLKGVRRKRLNERIERVVEQLELQSVHRRLIGRLSRGYRQRVALADALIADPKVLLLDEPTTGLDPLQRKAFRTLLQELAVSRSVLFSSHLLSEVEALVTRVLVLSAGKVVGDGDLKSLRAQVGMPEDAAAEDVFAALVAGEP